MYNFSKRWNVESLVAIRGKRVLPKLRVTTLDEAAAAEIAGIDLISVPPSLGVRTSLSRGLHRMPLPSLVTISGISAAPMITFDGQWPCSSMELTASTVRGRWLRSGCWRITGFLSVVMSGSCRPRRPGQEAPKRSASHSARPNSSGNNAPPTRMPGPLRSKSRLCPKRLPKSSRKGTNLFLISMGGGSKGHAQYLFGEDVLGENENHMPRHAKKYADFLGEYRRLQDMRIDAMRAYADEVRTGAFPSEPYIVHADEGVAGPIPGMARQGRVGWVGVIAGRLERSGSEIRMPFGAGLSHQDAPMDPESAIKARLAQTPT